MIHYRDDQVTVYHSDCLNVLPELPDASVDSVVTDPPYGLNFMGKHWDTGAVAFDVTVWKQCWRVLKPGGFLISFGGTRTFHRLAVAIEDAGFEIRDSIAWIYGSGFPKSLDVSKAIDRARDDRDAILAVTSWMADAADAAGITRADVDAHMGTSDMGGWWLSKLRHRCQVPKWEQWLQLKALLSLPDDMDAEVWRLNGRKGTPGEAWEQREFIGERKQRSNADNPDRHVGLHSSLHEVETITAPATDAAKQWQGWGTALKPAHEPIIVARKPLQGTVANNVQEHGTGALNIDACRIGTDERVNQSSAAPGGNGIRLHGGDGRDAENARQYAEASKNRPATTVTGRWPTNVVIDEHTAQGIDQQSGVSTAGAPRADRGKGGIWAEGNGVPCGPQYGDSGGASRFFPTFRYEAKAPGTERPTHNGTAHPTVKPLDLIRWLIRLVTPPHGLVLDPFAGSGTTAEAAIHEHMRAIVIEREADYLPVIVNRLHKPMQIGFDYDIGELDT